MDEGEVIDREEADDINANASHYTDGKGPERPVQQGGLSLFFDFLQFTVSVEFERGVDVVRGVVLVGFDKLAGRGGGEGAECSENSINSTKLRQILFQKGHPNQME